MKKELEEIIKQFKDFTDGVRMIMLIHRGKEGGANNRTDRFSKRKISTSKKEFEYILKEFLELKKISELPLRIYSSLNKRDIEKGIREFKRQQLDADYYDIESRNNFYLDIRNRFLGSLMKPSSRAETNFLIDIDEGTKKTIGEIIDRIDSITDVLLHYKTKNGYHLITKPFNLELLDKEYGEIKKDGLILLSY